MRILLFLLLIGIPLSLSGQRNRLSVLYTPSDNGKGVRYERILPKDQGYYFTALYGNYRGNDEYYISNHWRVSAGYTKAVENSVFLTVGGSLHKYGSHAGISSHAFCPVSLELGAGGNISRFHAGFIFDPLKWEGGFYFGINF